MILPGNFRLGGGAERFAKLLFVDERAEGELGAGRRQGFRSVKPIGSRRDQEVVGNVKVGLDLGLSNSVTQ